MTVYTVVVDPGQAELVIDDGYTTALPAGCLYEPAELLDMLCSMTATGWLPAGVRDMVLIIPEPWYGDRSHASAHAHGWSWPTPNPDWHTERGWAAWTRFTRRNSPTIHVGIRSLIDPDRTPLFDPTGDDPATIARRLTTWHRSAGVPFRGSPGVVGLSLLRDRIYADPRPGKQPRWHVDPDELPAELRATGDLIWWRPREHDEVGLPFVHGFDANGAYLHAARYALTGWDAIRQSFMPVTFDARVAGFWQLKEADVAPLIRGAWDDPMAPPILGPVEDETVWLSTPMVRFLVNASGESAPLPVLDAYTCRDSRLVWRPWAELLAGMRANIVAPGSFPAPREDRDAFLSTIKRTVSEAIGLAAPTERRGGRMSRHDHRTMIVDWWRATLLGHAYSVHVRAGRWPIRARVDCLWYPSEIENPYEAAEQLGLTIGTGVGQFKVHETVAGADWDDPDSYAEGEERAERDCYGRYVEDVEDVDGDDW